MRWYVRYIETHPWTTKCLTSGIVGQIGDLICQKYDHNPQIDWSRNCKMFLIGTLYFGPLLTIWYSKLLPTISRTLYPNFGKFGRVFSNLLFDRLLFAPFLMTFYYPTYGFMKLWSVEGIKNGWNETRLKIYDTMMLNWKVWTPAIFFNLWFINVKFQPLFNNMVGLAWTAILSHLTYSK